MCQWGRRPLAHWSCASSTRASIIFTARRWIAGSSPAMTNGARKAQACIRARYAALRRYSASRRRACFALLRSL